MPIWNAPRGLSVRSCHVKVGDNMRQTLTSAGQADTRAAPSASSHWLSRDTLPSTRDVFVGRQPIYNRQMDVFGYELLFRSGDVQHACFPDGRSEEHTSELQ